MPLTGSRHIKAFRPALAQARKLLRRDRDFFELRAQALKLRYWPQKTPTDSDGNLLDLNWCWIESLKGKHVGELRIDDEIGGFDNLRVIFFDAASYPHGGLPMIWILSALQKKRNEWTKNNIKTFDAQRRLVIERFYVNGKEAV